MSRITQPQQQGYLVRDTDVGIILAARRAVDKAMERLHDDNPAGFHAQRPTMTTCVHDPDCPFTKETP